MADGLAWPDLAQGKTRQDFYIEIHTSYQLTQKWDLGPHRCFTNSPSESLVQLVAEPMLTVCYDMKLYTNGQKRVSSSISTNVVISLMRTLNRHSLVRRIVCIMKDD